MTTRGATAVTAALSTAPRTDGPSTGRHTRQRYVLGLREVARQIGISSGYLGNLEAGRRCPSVTVAQHLAQVLELHEMEREQLFAAAVDDAGRDHPARR